MEKVGEHFIFSRLGESQVKSRESQSRGIFIFCREICIKSYLATVPELLMNNTYTLGLKKYKTYNAMSALDRLLRSDDNEVRMDYS